MVENTNNNAEISSERDKAIRLFTYLKELCALRTTQVRNIATYDQVFWFSNIPRNKLCQCIAWHVTNPQSSVPEKHSDLWIEVCKPTLKVHPEIPDEIEPWIKEEELADSSLSEPGFHEQIPLSRLQDEPDAVENEALASLSDNPQVFNVLVDYIATKWKPWASEDRELQQVQKVYNQLFGIYQRQEELGEQYEVIIGVGLLLWKSPNSDEIRRHILTIQTRIDFDRNRGIISVGSAPDGPKPVLEDTMLETADRPNPDILNAIEDDVTVLDNDPWDVVNLERVLRGFANSLPTSGDFSLSLEHAGGVSVKPVVILSPALILRKRTRRTFEGFYQGIIEEVKKGVEIPENIRRIITVVEDLPTEATCESAGNTTPVSPKQFDNELYFPLPANDEQKQIVQKIEHSRGVLVQGPPGTGKSHTIANLVAHFLAKGQRVLVTSETPRALKVLRKKLPPDIEELCVVWLGSDSDSQKTLEKSVLGITRRRAKWDAQYELGLIDQFACQLDVVRKEQARLRHDLRVCRESDVLSHSGVFGNYSGTLQQIAIQINEERDQFQWFLDRPENTTECTLVSDELLKMVKIHCALTPELVEQLKFHLFPQEQLVQPKEFQCLVDAEKKAGIAHKESENNRTYPGYRRLFELDCEKRRAIKGIISGILASQDNLSKHFHSWAERASREIAGDQDRGWRHILTSTKDHIGWIEHQLNENGSLEVTGLESLDFRLVEGQATILKNHLEEGKGFGFWFFKPQAVRNANYLIEFVVINGKPCNNLRAVEQLITWIEIQKRVQALSDLWKGIATPPTGSAILQCSAYRDLCEPIEDALAVYAHIEEVRKMCGDCSGIRFPAWHSQDEVRTFYGALDALDVEEDFLTAQRVFLPLAKSLADFINDGQAHSSTEQILQAVTKRDCALYRDTFETLSSLRGQADVYSLACNVHEHFHECAPRTCKSYDVSRSDPSWNEHFATFETAWLWAKTDRWLDEVRDRERPKGIQQELENSACRERDLLKNLAAAKAWQNCMQHMTERERQALAAWKEIVRNKIRGGHSRFVERYREEARQKFSEAQGAIPAWVMPLYQVVQTVRPIRKQFDLVIIDEASQSGPEALFLNYIADKIVVVGDNKQIAPSYVGVPREQVQFLRRKYLQDIPNEDMLDLETSLFSQAEIRFPDRIRLREHFRCMPEIIQFSNNLSYENEPLIPLRQYGADRLEPVQTVFVKDGYRKGVNEDIENPPEAKAIVTKIAECCENPMYTGKTFGVICLKGSSGQANLIHNLLVNEIGPEEVERRKITCGRPYDFQGDERDVIFLSMVDALSEGNIRCDIENQKVERRYNVAASRARDQLWLFHSMELNDLRAGSYQFRLLEYCKNPRVIQPPEIGEVKIADLRRMARNPATRRSRNKGEKIPGTPFDSWFEVDVFFKIIDRGYRVLPQFPVNKRHIDLVVEGLRGRLAVECYGDDVHLEQWEQDAIRQRELERCGWKFWIIWGQRLLSKSRRGAR